MVGRIARARPNVYCFGVDEGNYAMARTRAVIKKG